MRRAVPLLVAIMFASMPLSAYAASSLPFLSPGWHIVPEAHDFDASCPVGAPLSYGGVLQLIQNLVNAGIGIGVVAFTLLLAYAGFVFMTNGTNPEARGRARGMLINVAVGMVILLAAWLLVDFIMKTLYNDSSYGPWNSILADMQSSWCIKEKAPSRIGGLAGGALSTEFNGGTSQVLNGGTGACDASTVQAGAAAGGYRLSTQQANQLACIARYESTCGTARGPYNLNYSWNKATSNGKASSAAGAFQVLLSTNSVCYDNSACEAAGGTPGQALNCKSAFDSNGFPIPGAPNLQRCEQAAGNTACSASAAACQLQRQPGGFASMYAADSHAGSCQG